VKKKIAMFLLVIALALSLGVAPAVSVNADGALPHVNWLPPLSNQGDFQLKDGSTLPIKFTLTDPNTGAFVEDTGVKVDVNEVLFSDNFNDIEQWAPVAGDTSWSVGGGVLQCAPAIPHPRILATETLGYTNYVFEADARVVTGRGYALIFRAADYTSFYSFQYQDGSSALSLRLYQFTSFPTGADVASLVPYPTNNDWHHLKVAVSETNIKCYVDGNMVFNVTDTVPPTPFAGGIGFRTWSSTTAEFDNITVTALPATKTFLYGEGSENVRIAYDTVFSDDFSSYTPGTNGTPVWTPVTGDWSVESGIQADGTTGQVYSQNDISDNNAQKWSLAGDASWTDYVVEAKVKGIEGHYSSYGTNTWDGIVFRAMDSTHFYEYYYRTTSQDIIVVKHDGGTRTVVSGPVSFTCENGVWYTLKVVAKGNSFRFYADDVEISGLAFTDSSFASGKVGVYVWDGSEAQFDDVMVQTPHYIANLHTNKNGMVTGDYLITVWSGSGDELGTYLFDLTDAIQGKGRGKGKA
jgi:hypothetical protein